MVQHADIDHSGLTGVGVGNVQIETGQYTGNGATDRTITLGFTPKLVIILAQDRFFISEIGATRYGMRIWGTTIAFNNASTGHSVRPALTTNGFIVSGTDTTHTNFSGRVNDYIAFG